MGTFGNYASNDVVQESIFDSAARRTRHSLCHIPGFSNTDYCKLQRAIYPNKYEAWLGISNSEWDRRRRQHLRPDVKNPHIFTQREEWPPPRKDVVHITKFGGKRRHKTRNKRQRYCTRWDSNP